MPKYRNPSVALSYVLLLDLTGMPGLVPLLCLALQQIREFLSRRPETSDFEDSRPK